MRIPYDDIAKAELVERDAWLDLFDAAPPPVRDALGLASATIGGMGLLGCPSPS